jgi:ABC-type lipoprotein release transport system permease subunit
MMVLTGFALGASAGRVLRSVAAEGLSLAAAGAALGFAGAAAATRTLQGLLYDVTPLDGVTLTAVVLVVALTSLPAALHPAWRASRTNPSLVLRAGE